MDMGAGRTGGESAVYPTPDEEQAMGGGNASLRRKKWTKLRDGNSIDAKAAELKEKMSFNKVVNSFRDDILDALEETYNNYNPEALVGMTGNAGQPDCGCPTVFPLHHFWLLLWYYHWL